MREWSPCGPGARNSLVSSVCLQHGRGAPQGHLDARGQRVKPRWWHACKTWGRPGRLSVGVMVGWGQAAYSGHWSCPQGPGRPTRIPHCAAASLLPTVGPAHLLGGPEPCLPRSTTPPSGNSWSLWLRMEISWWFPTCISIFDFTREGAEVSPPQSLPCLFSLCLCLLSLSIFLCLSLCP